MTSITLIITLGLSLLLAPLASNAQPLPKVPRLGVLAAYSSTASARNHAAFRQGLHELGYVEGRNLILEVQSTAGDDERRLPIRQKLHAPGDCAAAGLWQI